MAIKAACVMAAGQAGLKSFPYFIDEFIERGIPQIVPRAFDHDSRQVQELDREFRSTWTEEALFGMGETQQLATRMDLGDPSIPYILKGINPIIENDSTMHDSPSRLAAWCRARLADECHKTLRKWREYKNDRTFRPEDQLAVVIPYCPEGPTSGTVGMYLGATMKQCCVDSNRNDVIVWGIELCPPIPPTLTGGTANNVFRGYVARCEMLGGVPLSRDNPEDNDRKPCFDINLAFDGGYSPAPYDQMADILPALNRAAAQGVACLLTSLSPDDPDVGEIADALTKGSKRWNACLVSVVSESHYNPAFRCLGYRAKLPWNRNPEGWDKRKENDKKYRFLSSVNNIEQSMDHEELPEVQTWFSEIKKKADELGAVGKLDNFIGKKGQLILQQAQRDDERLYSALLEPGQSNPDTMVRSQPFCVSIALSDELRQAHSERIVDRNHPDHSKPISEILGIAASDDVQRQITDFLQIFLERSDIPANAPSRAKFQEIKAISIRTPDSARNDVGFRPTESILRTYLDSAQNHEPPCFHTHELSDGDGTPKPLLWEPFKGGPAGYARKERIERPVPAEYSFLILARVKEGEGFRDLTTYKAMADHHNQRVNSLDWKYSHRYYSVRVPDDLLRLHGMIPPSSNHFSADGMPASNDLARERA